MIASFWGVLKKREKNDTKIHDGFTAAPLPNSQSRFSGAGRHRSGRILATVAFLMVFSSVVTTTTFALPGDLTAPVPGSESPGTPVPPFTPQDGWTSSTSSEPGHPAIQTISLTLPSHDPVAGRAIVVPAIGSWMLRGQLRGTADRLLGVSIGETSSAPVFLDGSWQRFGVTIQGTGQPMTVSLIPQNEWAVGDELAISNVVLAAAGPRQTTVVPGTRVIQADGQDLVVKGYNYNIGTIGSPPLADDWPNDPARCQKDAVLMAGAGVTVIRIFIKNPQHSTPVQQDQCLAAFSANGIGVVWVLTFPSPANQDPCQNQENTCTAQQQQAYIDAYWTIISQAVSRFSQNPATLFWTIGNEQELNSTRTGTDLWFGGILNTLAGRLRQEDSLHLVGTTITPRKYGARGNLPAEGDCYYWLGNANVPNIQFWGLNFYPNDPVFSNKMCGVPATNLFAHISAADPRPKFFTEFGADRFRCNPGTTSTTSDIFCLKNATPSLDSKEAQTAQASWLTTTWDDVATRIATSSTPTKAVSGAIVFYWSDDWNSSAALILIGPDDTPCVNGSPLTHDTCWKTHNAGGPDGRANPEWGGLTHAQLAGLAPPRVTTIGFDQFAIRWSSILPPTITAGVTIVPSANCFNATVQWTTSEAATTEVQLGPQVVVVEQGNRVFSDSTIYRRVAYQGAMSTFHSASVVINPGVRYQIVPRSTTADGRSVTTGAQTLTC